MYVCKVCEGQPGHQILKQECGGSRAGVRGGTNLVAAVVDEARLERVRRVVASESGYGLCANVAAER